VSMSIACQWCNTVQPIGATGPQWCRHCLHRIDVPKDQCDCLACHVSPALLQQLQQDNPTVEPAPAAPFQFLKPDDPLHVVNFTDCTHGFIEINGRHFKAPHCSVTVYPDRVFISIGDQRQPDQWVHVIIRGAIVGAWAGIMSDAAELLEDLAGAEDEESDVDPE